jgi:F0F1-type ATP synthase assembly protein I
MTDESRTSHGPAEPSRGEGRPGEGTSASEYAGAGFQFAFAMLLFFFIGRWADGKLGTAPWLMLLGMVVGGSAGFYSMYRKLMAAQEREERATRERKAREMEGRKDR